MNIWINRAVTFILYFVAICIAEKLNLRPAGTFTFAVAWMIGLNFIFAIIEYLTKQGGKMAGISGIFEKGHINKGWEKIEKWINDEDVCAYDLMAIVCAKFGSVPQVRANEVTTSETRLMVGGDVYKITIEKEV